MLKGFRCPCQELERAVEQLVRETGLVDGRTAK